MKKLIFKVFLLLLVMRISVFASTEIKFSSVFTDVAKDCPQAPRRDKTSVCKGIGDYWMTVVEGKDRSIAGILNSNDPNDHFDSFSVEAEDLPMHLEWLLANNVPFVVIYQTNEYERIGTGDEDEIDYNHKIGEHVHGVGLHGFDSINIDITVQKGLDAFQKARDIAEKAY